MRASAHGTTAITHRALGGVGGAILLVALMLALAACGGDTTSVLMVGAPQTHPALPLPTPHYGAHTGYESREPKVHDHAQGDVRYVR